MIDRQTRAAAPRVFGASERAQAARHGRRGLHLYEGWVIANHILVSFHVAFISSVLALPAAAVLKGEVLRFIFVSYETLISALFLYVTFHTGIAIHEMGHLLTAARLDALKESVLLEIKPCLKAPLLRRMMFYAKVFVLAPYGRAIGIRREGLNYYPDAPYNLAVAAAGPRTSRNAAFITLPPAVILLAVGLALPWSPAIYVGRLLLGMGVVTLLDFLLADPGKYREFREQERIASEKARSVKVTTDWYKTVSEVRRRMVSERMQTVIHPRLGPVAAPWQFRNCGMGGRHTEKEYPESNISMQEAMFLILGAGDYQEAQEMTVRLQTRLKEIIEKEEGGRVMGIGLEGGLAPYIEKGEFPLPEVRLWAMMTQAIQECGFQPGRDVAIALDPAMSELEIAYRREFNMPDAVGTYLFWRDKAKLVMDRDGVLDVYLKAINQYGLPIASIEDGFSENDAEGWRALLNALGDRVFIIGDDLVTTNDRTIEECAEGGLINTALIKANQIGTLSETLLAMLVALGKGLDLVISHRSKSPNDDMEAHIALAANALGLKAGGGANTERLVKYQSVAELLGRTASSDTVHALRENQKAVIKGFYAYEEPTNAGIPTVGTTAELLLPDSGVLLRFRGATPLGTSAGSGEAIHLVDSLLESTEYREVIAGHTSLFQEVEPGVYAFRKEVREGNIRASGDEALAALYERAQRYQGKGCLTAVGNVHEIIARTFGGKEATSMTLREIDGILLGLERAVAIRRKKLDADAPVEQCIAVMQRKQNLGMNAVLSVSLALARGVAHVRGKELYELLREEMLDMIDRFASDCGIEIPGSTFSDYTSALRQASEVVQGRGARLHEALREISGIYAAGATLPA
jgi:enolase